MVSAWVQVVGTHEVRPKQHWKVLRVHNVLHQTSHYLPNHLSYRTYGCHDYLSSHITYKNNIDVMIILYERV